MTKEQATEIKRIMGNLEESKADLEPIQESLQTEWDDMTDEQQKENPDLLQLEIEIESMGYALDAGIDGIMGKLEDISGGIEK